MEVFYLVIYWLLGKFKKYLDILIMTKHNIDIPVHRTILCKPWMCTILMAMKHGDIVRQLYYIYRASINYSSTGTYRTGA